MTRQTENERNYGMLPANDHAVTGIQRHQAEQAQAKLQQRRWERDHFSDGVPVEMYTGVETLGKEAQ